MFPARKSNSLLASVSGERYGQASSAEELVSGSSTLPATVIDTCPVRLPTLGNAITRSIQNKLWYVRTKHRHLHKSRLSSAAAN